ncbi:hypothetical protein SGPA1_21165 [Streptomyces misionensis JCM 4497]
MAQELVVHVSLPVASSGCAGRTSLSVRLRAVKCPSLSSIATAETLSPRFSGQSVGIPPTPFELYAPVSGGPPGMTPEVIDRPGGGAARCSHRVGKTAIRVPTSNDDPRRRLIHHVREHRPLRERCRPLLRGLERHRAGGAAQGGRRRVDPGRRLHRPARRRPRARGHRRRDHRRARAVPGVRLPSARRGGRPPRHRALRLGAGERGRRLGAGRRVRRGHAGRRGPYPAGAGLPGPGAGGCVTAPGPGLRTPDGA